MDAIDARIDLSGKIMIAKEADSSETTPIILQWMLMACDPNAVSRETCGDLPVNMCYSIIYNLPLLLNRVYYFSNNLFILSYD